MGTPRRIPDNAFKGRRIFGFKRRNLMEGVVFTVLFAFLIWQIPFVLKVKIIIILCFGVGILLSCAIGIKGLSPVQAITKYFTYKDNTYQISYRRFDENAKSPDSVFTKDGRVKNVKCSQALYQKLFK